MVPNPLLVLSRSFYGDPHRQDCYGVPFVELFDGDVPYRNSSTTIRMFRGIASTIGGSALDAFVGIVVGKISSLIDHCFDPGIKDEQAVEEIKKWPQMMESIWGVLKDAETQQQVKSGVRRWLEDVEDLAHDIEDKLDELRYEALRQQVRVQMEAASKNLSSSRVHHPSIVDTEMISEMEDITARLRNIMERKMHLDLLQTNLVAPSISSCSLNQSRAPSGPVSSEPVIYGRQREKKTIVDFLVTLEERVGVIPIVGMGGLGKTTLAQYAFNKQEVVDTFWLRAWVCVSKDYEMSRIFRCILEAVTSSPCNLHDPSLIQRKIYEALKGKRFLIVLDDLWNESYGDWEALRAPLMEGAAGSKIIVTTRSVKVADAVRTGERYESLPCLSDGDCWSLFCRHAGLDPNSDSSLVDIGRKIAKKCSGLPLAARAMGGLLRWKNDEADWEAILNCNSWSSKEGNVEIMAVLRLSFNALPCHLQRCFQFCAVFPEDYRFREDDVVMLWIGAGLIQPDQIKRGGIKQVEAESRDCFRELVARSMFLQSSNNSSHFTMHDLVGDLAREVSGNKCCRLEDDNGRLQRARHLSLKSSRFQDIVRDLGFLQRKKLPWRTFLLLGGFSLPFQSHYALDALFSKVLVLRVLSLAHYCYPELSESIGQLKLLRYLDLSSSAVRKLPNSLTSLHNLEILILDGCSVLNELPVCISELINLRRLDMRDCYGLRELPLGFGNLANLCHINFSNCHNLRELPSGIGNLVNLYHLDMSYCSGLTALSLELGNLTNLSVFDISGCYDIREMPLGIGNLKQLRKISDFIVGGGNGLSLRSLGNLKRLQGMLKISNLENVACDEDAKLAGLSDKLLEDLTLEWTSQAGSSSSQARVLEWLQPHKNLRKLCISGFEGSSFPHWLAVSSTSLGRLVVLKLINCDKCTSLILMGTLPALKELVVEDCSLLEISLPKLPALLKLSICGCKGLDCDGGFSLTSLVDCNLSRIETCSPLFKDKVGCALHLAKVLFIGCSIIATTAPQWRIPSFTVIGNGIQEQLEVERLNVEGQTSVTHLPQWISHAKFLTSLQIWDCQALQTLLPATDFPDTLSSIEIRGCHQLTSISREGKLPVHLRTLTIAQCPKLETITERISSLRSLQVHSGCPLLVQKLPHCLPYLPALTSLKIAGCNLENLKPLVASGGLSMMPSLKHLHLVHCPDIESFPTEEMVSLPQTLTTLTLDDFPDLKRLSSSPCLSSLVDLSIWSCPNLELIPNEGLPRSLQTLDIRDCHLLEGKLRADHVSHIPLVKLDNCRVYFSH